MDFEYVKLGFQVLQFLLTGGCCIYVYMASKDRVTNERISEFQKDVDVKLDDHGERIAKIEQGPTHGDLDGLHTRITEVARGVSSLGGEMTGVKTTLNLIHEHLLRGKQ